MSSKPNKWLITLAIAALVAPATLQTNALAASGAASKEVLTSPPFKDISNVASEQKASILQAVEAGLLQGAPNGSYRPMDLLTRQEMAALLTRALQLPTNDKTAKSSFADVDTNSWSSPYIEAVHRAGLMNGDGSSKFRPKAAVTKEEAAVLLMRAAGLSISADVTASSKVSDWKLVSPWARPYVNAALQSGSMETDQPGFAPKSSVKRKDIAQYMMSTFFPKEHLAQLQKIEDGKAWINGIEYKLSDSVKGILHPSNRDVLKGADIQFAASQRTIESITKLVIHASGQAPAEQNAEFSGNLILDGHDSLVNGDLVIDGDYVSIMNLNVKINLTIMPGLEHDFYASKLTVQGKTGIQGGDQNTVMFNASTLNDVEVSKQDVHVVTQGKSTVDQMSLTSNAKIENDPSSTLKQLNVLTGAQQVELQGTIQQLSVNSDQSVALTGHASINALAVNSSSPVKLEVIGTISNLQVNNPAANITVSSSSQVTNTSLASGVSQATVTGVSQTTAAASGSVGSSDSPAPVVSNTAPVLISKYSDQNITVGDPELQIDLLGHFKDAEQSELKYSAVSSSTKITSVRVEGTNLFIKAVGKGMALITITADDQVGKRAGASFKVRVNEPPAALGIPDQVKQLGSGGINLSLGTFFSDSENDPMVYEVVIDDPTVATFSLTGDQLVLTPAKVGSARVTVKAFDGRGGSASQSFQMEVTAVPDQSPIVNQKPANRTITLGAADYILDLTPVFSDPDNDLLNVSAASLDASVVTVVIDGNQATVHAVSSGQTTIQLTAKDGRGGEVTTEFDVIVNAPPASSGIPDQTKEMNSGDIQLSLNQFFSDPDGDTLAYRVSDNSDPTVVSAVLNGDVLTLTPLKAGSASVSVQATDGRGGEVTDTFLTNVTAAVPQNHDPIESKPADKSLTVGDPIFSLDLGPVFTDPDGDTLTYKASSSNETVASAEIDGTQLKIHALAAGTTIIEINAEDGRGGKALTTFQVNVQSAASPPSSSNQSPQVVASINDQVLTVGITNPRTYDLSQLFYDDDGDALMFTATVASSGVVNADVSASNLTLTPGNLTGSTKVTITADDGNGGTATYDLQVTNAPLATNGIVQIRTKQGVKDPITYDLSTIFPGENSFKVYLGTADSTFLGPMPLNGAVWTWSGDSLQYYWVIGANGTAAVFQVIPGPQGPEDLYFSQYVSLDQTRTAIELFYNPVGDTSKPIENAGYSLEVHQYNLNTNTPKVWSLPLNTFYKGMPYIFIDSTFYDYFDITPASYYNDEMMLLESNTNVTTGYVLKKNGVTIDVLGDPDGKTQFMPYGGTIIRKSGIWSGTSIFSPAGEWNSYPVGTLQFISHHTI
ncbi:RTX toxin [Paenibacillus sp. CAA11]|uniref:S-layer homology domain-containing protein n=1 Tax=Paenibacillus sp. CAA11 TaxID=1532905 RepID=UPI000D33F803|nr:S-layer homology domain-containing protein [Paenibacillus sp. CAA11]AWB45549.1 RTX toxin [Paenibacillus sp. CAA11]